METTSNSDHKRAAWHWVLFGAAIALTVTWLFLTPHGLLGKADAVGYAVCHQIEPRSFQINGRSFPLCARCSGLFLGALLGLIYQIRQGKKGRMPPLGASLFFGFLAFAWVFDGFNSFLMLIPSISSLYVTQNWTRLVTGTGMGLAVSAILMPAFIQTMFSTWEDQSAFKDWKAILIVVGAAVVLDLVLLLEVPWILYPLALLSAGGVLALLIMVYSTVLVMLFKRDNTYQGYRALLIPLVGGYLLALLQIGVIDLVRYLLTGTWGGFSL
ncbi:MAG: DUF2085 domain-containing protein [Brevefilum sp.]|nr:DUF2085 domain-containing protein [Brevefilum sp.]